MLFFGKRYFLALCSLHLNFFFQKTSIFNLHIEANNCSVLHILKHYERHTDKNKNPLFCTSNPIFVIKIIISGGIGIYHNFWSFEVFRLVIG